MRRLRATRSPSDTRAASASSSGGSGQPIVVGGANFSESTLLAEIYAGALKAKGIDATTKLNIGSREIYLRALEDNSVQVFPEYTGALAFNYDKAYTGTDPDEVYQHVQEVLPDTLVVLDKSAAEDNDSMVVTKETAAEKNLKTDRATSRPSPVTSRSPHRRSSRSVRRASPASRRPTASRSSRSARSPARASSRR